MALVADEASPLLNPTTLGIELKDENGGLALKAHRINQLLATAGLQVEKRDDKRRPYWVLTPAGEHHGEFLDVGKSHGTGTPVRQLKWNRSVLPLLRDALRSERERAA
jgi:hypothetical protein